MEGCRKNISAMISGIKFHLFLRRKYFKGLRKAAQMKTTPWLPNWSTCWLLKKKTYFCRSWCRPAELRSPGTGLSACGSAVNSKALLMSHVSRCLHYGSVRVCSANKNTDTPTRFSELKHSWEKSGVSTRKEESTVPTVAAQVVPGQEVALPAVLA